MRRLICLIAASLLALTPAGVSLAQSADAPVRVSEDRETFILDNGVIRAVVSKRNGDLLSMTYKDVETLTPDSGGHSGVYWSHDTTGGVDVVSRVSIDPKANGGERAEVSVKGISGGVKMGHGPGTPTDGDLAVDIDIRFALGRGDKGVYTYTAFEHRPQYPAGVMGEARIAVELARYFDDIHVDDLRSGRYPIVKEDADKYVYVTRQADERAFGWTSSTRKMGWFLLNPSAEYLSGGPNKSEFVAHGDPTVLNYWKSSHNGGANVTVAAGELWTRVVGPYMFYVNEGADHQAMITDARAQLKREEGKWPYNWVNAPGFAPPASRSEVVGRLLLNDPLLPNGGRHGGPLTVGLTKTPYTVTPVNAQGVPQPQRTIQWQQDAKNLQHWARSHDPDGAFTIPDVPAGQYTLYAYAAGVIGEFSKADIVIPDRGGRVDLGRLEWKPVRHGRTLWQVGTPDRDAREFNTAEQYFMPAIQLKYAERFPNGVRYRIGASSPAKDWFFAHGPQPAKGAAKPAVVPFSGLGGAGEATTYTVVFDLPAAPKGAATLRTGFTTYSGPGINVGVNGAPVGVTRPPLSDNAFPRHQIYGLWSETALTFDASTLKAGENQLTLTVPAGSYNNVAVYDYVRLELDEVANAPPKPAVLALAPARTAAAAPAATEATAAPSAVLTVHDDPRFGLPGLEVKGFALTARDNALYLRVGNGAERRLIGPEALAGGRLGAWRASPDGRRVAFAIAESAAPDAYLTLRVIETESGRLLPDSLARGRYSAIAWSPDGAGFYYSRVPIPTPGPMARYQTAQEVFFHRLGDTREQDRRLLASDRGSMIHYAEISGDGRWLVVNGSVAANGKSDITLIDLTRPIPGPFKAMRSMLNNWQFAGSSGDLIYFVTDWDAPRRRLVALDVSRPSLPLLEIVPQNVQTLQAARLAAGVMWLSYKDGAGANAVSKFDLAKLPAGKTLAHPARVGG